MTALGEINTTQDVLAVDDSGFAEATGVSTTSGTLVDITGSSFTVTIGANGSIVARMTVQCSTSGGSPQTAAYAISINSVDGTEIQRYLSGTSDTGSLSVQARVTGLSSGTYTVVGRHRRVSGASTLVTDVAQVSALAILD